MRDKELLKNFVLEVIKKDSYYKDGSEDADILDELEEKIKDDKKLNEEQKKTLVSILVSSAEDEMRNVAKKKDELFLMGFDNLSMYSDCYFEYCGKRG